MHEAAVGRNWQHLFLLLRAKLLFRRSPFFKLGSLFFVAGSFHFRLFSRWIPERACIQYRASSPINPTTYCAASVLLPSIRERGATSLVVYVSPAPTPIRTDGHSACMLPNPPNTTWMDCASFSLSLSLNGMYSTVCATTVLFYHRSSCVEHLNEREKFSSYVRLLERVKVNTPFSVNGQRQIMSEPAFFKGGIMHRWHRTVRNRVQSDEWMVKTMVEKRGLGLFGTVYRSFH